MGSKKGKAGGSLARMLFALAFSYAFVIQSVFVPVARAREIERAGLDGALAILCLTGNIKPGLQNEDVPQEMRHDLGCCVVCGRVFLDIPAIEPIAFQFPAPAALAVKTAEYTLPQGRAPPDITATPRQSRAPPIHS